MDTLSFEELVAIFAAAFGLIAALLPLSTWRARLIHALYTAILVVAVAAVAARLSERATEERIAAIGAVADRVLARHAGEEVSPGFIADAIGVLSDAGADAEPTLYAVRRVCDQNDCDTPAPIAAYSVKGVLETLSARAAAFNEQ